jgi:hypothetical protein
MKVVYAPKTLADLDSVLKAGFSGNVVGFDLSKLEGLTLDNAYGYIGKIFAIRDNISVLLLSDSVSVGIDVREGLDKFKNLTVKPYYSNEKRGGDLEIIAPSPLVRSEFPVLEGSKTDEPVLVWKIKCAGFDVTSSKDDVSKVVDVTLDRAAPTPIASPFTLAERKGGVRAPSPFSPIPSLRAPMTPLGLDFIEEVEAPKPDGGLTDAGAEVVGAEPHSLRKFG